MDVARLNFSHCSADEHAETARLVREAAGRAGRQVAILQDLSGPKIRTGRLVGGTPIPVPRGSRLRITTGDEEGREDSSHRRRRLILAGLEARTALESSGSLLL